MSAVPNLLKAQKARAAAKVVRDEYRARGEEPPQAMIDEAKRDAIALLEREWAETVVPRELAAAAAAENPQPKPAPVPVKNVVWFESRDKEPTQFEVAGIGSIRCFASGRLQWEVEPSDVERFTQHFHVTTGRVRRKG